MDGIRANFNNGQFGLVVGLHDTYGWPSNNKSLGIMVNNKQELENYKKLGFNMIAVGTEMNILSRSISQILK